MSDASSGQPLLRIVRGEPTPEELAVVMALALGAATGGAGGGSNAADDVPAPVHGRWNDPAWQLRQAVFPGRGAWRSAVR